MCNLKQLRVASGMGRWLLADRARVSPSYITAAEEHGVKPPDAVCSRIAAVLGVKTTELWPPA